MKTFKYIFFICAIGLVLNGCEDRLDIVPKGEITLSKTADLELLLNQEYNLRTNVGADLGMLCNTNVSAFNSVVDILANKQYFVYSCLTYDETIDRPSICLNDTRYEAIYKYINNMNTVIAKAPGTDGSEKLKVQIEAEARVMRAYLHFLLVNIHAAQYDEATLQNKGGIPYVDNIDLGIEKTKNTLSEVYEKILADCDDRYINVLPDHNSDCCRGDRGFANAVRAMVLFQMKKYSDAIPYAVEALNLRSKIDDRSIVKEQGMWTITQTDESNYVYMKGSSSPISPGGLLLSYETKALLDPDDYLLKYDHSCWDEFMGEMMGGLSGTYICANYNVMQNSYGIRTEQIYYLLGEALIRTGQIDEGLEEIDKVRRLRIENCQPFSGHVSSEVEAMELLRNAKQIEMIGSYQTFFDTKRWNTEPQYKRVITRNLGLYGQYSISPDSPLWILPFPASATRINKSLTQNF